MIRRNEYNKLIQLINAGILTSEKDFQANINALSPILGEEIYTFNLLTDVKNKLTTSIDDNLIALNTFITDINNFEKLKLSKNTYKVFWVLEFTNVVINVEKERYPIEEFVVDTNQNNTYTEIAQLNNFLDTEFVNIKNYIQNPKNASSLVTNIKFSEPDTNAFNLYFKFFDPEYKSFIDEISSDISINFGYTLKLDYMKV